MPQVRSPLAHGLPPVPGRLLGRLSTPLGRFLLPPLLNRTMARPIGEGRVDFLRERTMAVHVTDLELEWRFTLDTAGERIVRTDRAADATIRGDSLALLLLAARRLDPDTLFFHRRLMVEGDTELGLQAKNLLDTLEPDDLPPPLTRFLDHAGRMAERWS